MRCKICNEKLLKGFTYCTECHPFNTDDCCASRIDVRARTLANQFPEKLNIVWECACNGRKEKHHFDYNKAFDIFLACKKCHWWFHKTINKYQKH